jgi:hypothetical protein
MTHRNRITFRCSDEQYLAAKLLAVKRKTDVSEVIRAAINNLAHAEGIAV